MSKSLKAKRGIFRHGTRDRKFLNTSGHLQVAGSTTELSHLLFIQCIQWICVLHKSLGMFVGGMTMLKVGKFLLLGHESIIWKCTPVQAISGDSFHMAACFFSDGCITVSFKRQILRWGICQPLLQANAGYSKIWVDQQSQSHLGQSLICRGAVSRQSRDTASPRDKCVVNLIFKLRRKTFKNIQFENLV